MYAGASKSSATGKNVLLDGKNADLDHDIDDYEDSRIELRAVGHNLTSVLMNPRETMLEEFTDEFEIEQSVPLEFPNYNASEDDMDETCGAYFKDPGCLYNRFKQRLPDNALQLSRISRLPANAEVAYCFSNVPEQYFRPDFSIRNTDIFHSILKVEEKYQTQQQRDSPNSTPSEEVSVTQGAGEQETSLTNYLDLVEVALLRQIMTRSPAFFRALDDIYELQSMVSRAATRIIHLRRSLRGFESGLSEGPMRIPRLEQRRMNEIALHEKLLYMQRVLAGRAAVRNLLEMDDYIGALEVISSTKRVFQEHLSGVVSMRNIGSQLEAYDGHIGDVMCDRFVNMAVNWSSAAADEESDGDNEMTASEGADRTRAEAQAVGQLLQALTHVGRLQGALDGYTVRIQDNVRLVVRTCLLEYLSGAEEDGEGSNSFAQKVRTMSTENFLACLSMCYESLLQTLSRATSLHNFLVCDTLEEELVNGSSAGEITIEDKKWICKAAGSCLISTSELAQKSVCQLLMMRKESNARLTTDQMKFLWEISGHFVTGVEQLSPAGGIELSSQALRQGLISQTRKFLDHQHETFKGKLVNTLDGEKWVQCDVSSERQAALDRLTSGRSFLRSKAKPTQNNDETRNGGTPPPAVASSSGSKKRKEYVPVIVDGMEFKVVWSALFVVEIVLVYLDVAIEFPPITKDVITKAVEVLTLFDTRSKQLVLGAQAIQSAARLKSIAAKHLGITAQCLTFLQAVLPHLRAALLAQLPPEHHLVLVELDRVSKSLMDHHAKVLSKFVSIVGDFVDSSSVKLRQIDWDRFNGQCEYFEDVSRNVTALHRVLQGFLPGDQMQDVFTRIFSLLNRKIPSHFDEVMPSTQTGKQRIMDEIDHLVANLSKLKHVNISALTVEETFRKKFDR